MQPTAPPHLESTETILSSSITKLDVFICCIANLADGY
ncbi:MFS transporter, partial [Bacillus tropicus]|nr:MFS transporter [Bacillus tropicus]